MSSVVENLNQGLLARDPSPSQVDRKTQLLSDASMVLSNVLKKCQKMQTRPY